jgi:nuclear receptor co-repressor 1
MTFCLVGNEGTRDREGVTRGGGSGRSSSGGNGDSSTLTAASLIDAIITHQINQSSTDSPGGGNQGGTSNSPAPTRPGDRLFQVQFSLLVEKAC